MFFEFVKMSASEESSFVLMPAVFDKCVLPLQMQNLNDYRSTVCEM